MTALPPYERALTLAGELISRLDGTGGDRARHTAAEIVGYLAEARRIRPLPEPMQRYRHAIHARHHLEEPPAG